MMDETPWGPFSSLDRTDRDLAHEILKWDKHQVLEGMVVERAFDQMLEHAASESNGGLQLLDLETFVVKSPTAGSPPVAFVWLRGTQPGQRRYLDALAKVFTVYHLELINDDFHASLWDSKHLTPRRPLADLVRDIGRKPRYQAVAPDVRNEVRQNTAIWGFLAEALSTEQIWTQLVIPRLLVNFLLQPFFIGTWNLDRICLFREELWMLELKHKFPMGSGDNFGLNDGELRMMRFMSDAGLRPAHMIIVKPVRDITVKPMYLFNNRQLRERAAVIGVEMTRQKIDLIERKPLRKSAKHTTITGTGTVGFRELPVSIFSRLGTYGEEGQKISPEILKLLSGQKLEQASGGWLAELAQVAPTTPRK